MFEYPTTSGPVLIYFSCGSVTSSTTSVPVHAYLTSDPVLTYSTCGPRTLLVVLFIHTVVPYQ